MLSLRTSIVLSALLASAVSAVSTDGLLLAKRQRDTTYPACDADPNSNKLIKGAGVNWQTSDDPTFYVAPGTGACNLPYTDDSNIVCINPGWINSANVNKCNTWVEVLSNGIKSQARVLDVCGAVANSTFGCNDIYLGKQVFEQLAGANKTAVVAAGRLPSPVQWKFIRQPCWGCYAGLPGKDPNGSKDTCKGKDADGYLRCGRRSGADRIVGTNSDVVCNSGIISCEQAKDEATLLPKYKSTSKA